MRFRIRDLLILTLLAAMLTGGWRNHCLLKQQREDQARLKKFIRENDALSQMLKRSENDTKRFKFEAHALSGLFEAKRDEAAYWQKEYFKRAAYDPGPGR
jgi:hypothetical protein